MLSSESAINKSKEYMATYKYYLDHKFNVDSYLFSYDSYHELVLSSVSFASVLCL